jgi:transposase
MIAGLIKYGNKAKQLVEDYNLNPRMIGRWRREFTSKFRDFSKKKVLTCNEQQLKGLKIEFI